MDRGTKKTIMVFTKIPNAWSSFANEGLAPVENRTWNCGSTASAHRSGMPVLPDNSCDTMSSTDFGLGTVSIDQTAKILL